MSRFLSRASILALLLVSLSTARAQGATVALLDHFDDGNLATNTGLGGIGNGFTTAWVDCGSGSGVSASEANGKVTVTGGSCVHWIESNDAINPTGTTMIWSIASLNQGAYIGWVQAGKDACCETGMYLSIEPHRVVFDMQAKGGDDPFQWQGRYFDIPAGSTTSGEVFPGYTPGTDPGPLTAILSFDEAGWHVSIHGAGIEIVKSGNYFSCPYPSSGQCIGLGDILSYPGVNGTLRPVAGSFRENASADFDSVLVTSTYTPPMP